MVYQLTLGYKMKILETIIRNKDTTTQELRKALTDLGKMMGSEALGHSNLLKKKIVTPLLSLFSGVDLGDDNGISIIISTKDDYSFFADGIAQGFSSAYRGFIDFANVWGKNIYSSSYRSIEFPEIKPTMSVKRIVIAKSVIASGCTAVTLAKVALSKYYPKELLIIAPFFSQQGVDELQEELHSAKIYTAFGPDELNENGLLVPGVGNIDARLRE